MSAAAGAHQQLPSREAGRDALLEVSGARDGRAQLRAVGLRELALRDPIGTRDEEPRKVPRRAGLARVWVALAVRSDEVLRRRADAHAHGRVGAAAG